MTDDAQARRPGRFKLWLASGIVAAIVLLLVVPPYISISRYRSRITQLVSASVGRPVRLSSVELRMLPRPSFVLTDLAVEEDPAYGAEPILHANTVRAAIRLWSLWRGEMQIDRISVDEASLNLVHAGPGRWNLDSLFRSVAARSVQGASGQRSVPFPYLEATNSRINIKEGVEKLPYSLVDADLSFWREDPGEWHVRLRGQPARTDVTVNLADTGIVRLEGTLRHAPELNQMPLHLDMDWREAQLGQLSRLLLGSDEGWRGDMTGEVHVDGTADSARIRTRLRASGVHRVEFAPISAMDFDASCTLNYHLAARAMDGVECNSPVGDGRVRLSGSIPPGGQRRGYTLELDRVPAQLGLDALRTVRRGIDPGLEAVGAVSGRLDYTVEAAAPPTPVVSHSAGHQQHGRTHPVATGPLSGSLTIAGLRLSGGKLSRPFQIPKATVEAAPGPSPALATKIALPAGGPAPLNMEARLDLHGYSGELHGSASIAELREMGQLVNGGVPELEKLTGPPVGIDVQAQGPWVTEGDPAVQPGLAAPQPGQTAAPQLLPAAAGDQVTATLTLHDEIWRPEFLAGPLEVSSGTLHADGNGSRWEPVVFAYGPVKGSGSLELAAHCTTEDECAPRLAVRFDTLDVGELQAAILGARQHGTLISTLLARLRPASGTGWPTVKGRVEASSVVLGPVTLSDAKAEVKVDPTGVEVEHFSGKLFDGEMRGTGSMKPGDQPVYNVEGQFDGVQAAGLGSLLGMTWSGDGLSGSGKVELSGFTDRDLAASAKGTLHFDWRRGAVEGGDADVPVALEKFDRWTADLEVGGNAVTLKHNQVVHAAGKSAVEGSMQFGDPPRVTFGAPAQAKGGPQ